LPRIDACGKEILRVFALAGRESSGFYLLAYIMFRIPIQ
jgi:hypothetical protein